MHYLIDAWLENGVPQLNIRVADTGTLRLRWSCTDKLNLNELAKTPGRDQSCLKCDACVARSEYTAQGVQPDKLLRLVDQRPNRKPDARR